MIDYEIISSFSETKFEKLVKLYLQRGYKKGELKLDNGYCCEVWLEPDCTNILKHEGLELRFMCNNYTIIYCDNAFICDTDKPLFIGRYPLAVINVYKDKLEFRIHLENGRMFLSLYKEYFEIYLNINKRVISDIAYKQKLFPKQEDFELLLYNLEVYKVLEKNLLDRVKSFCSDSYNENYKILS